ncbi:GNAT family N-acetyltransferase [Pseudarthrobacter sp. H3Y2-7]|uniref:GNAT family N-acetyltransferase n=1 Tax=Pseudarthrobacter naphthalenicus TaxID=3031328 RepID=UPI0023AF120B|nr:GNAT family N-acetyltransferase [Pseudarthrobacter sp. H3Y2-7]MDE8670783.1 GNAT family N-acetyltransferase [Pseudarthrobacter sp. H3Y2-7]
MFNPYSPYYEPGFGAWKQGLEALPPSEVLIRRAEQTAEDGRRMRWMQADCESTNIHSVEDNVSRIGQQLVLLAEIADYPVGFCCVFAGQADSDPLFIQLVAVVPSARRRGVGLGLLKAAVRWQPQRGIAMATLEDNAAARSLNERFAQAIGGRIQRVPVSRFRPSDLGFARGERHRVWMIERQQPFD